MFRLKTKVCQHEISLIIQIFSSFEILLCKNCSCSSFSFSACNRLISTVICKARWWSNSLCFKCFCCVCDSKLVVLEFNAGSEFIDKVSKFKSEMSFEVRNGSFNCFWAWFWTLKLSNALKFIIFLNRFVVKTSFSRRTSSSGFTIGFSGFSGSDIPLPFSSLALTWMPLSLPEMLGFWMRDFFVGLGFSKFMFSVFVVAVLWVWELLPLLLAVSPELISLNGDARFERALTGAKWHKIPKKWPKNDLKTTKMA